MGSLPSDIWLHIFSRVPTEAVLDCKLVCNGWLNLISTTHFTSMHLARQLHRLIDVDHAVTTKAEAGLLFACQVEEMNGKTSLYYGGNFNDRIDNDQEYSYKAELKKISHPRLRRDYIYPHLVGSCNGLVCLFIHHHRVNDPVYICNPFTKEYVYLPSLVNIPTEREGRHHRTACGFGYIYSTNEYKVVRIFYPNGERHGHVQVYTLGSGQGWRNKGTISILLGAMYGGIYLNGTIYWKGGVNVMAFDLTDEEFRSFSCPPCEWSWNRDRHGIAVLGGYLCFYVNKERTKIWSLKKGANDTKETWCKDFDIEHHGATGISVEDLSPLLLTKNEDIIFKNDDSVLYYYNTKTKILKRLSNNDASTEFAHVDAIPHVHTFASLEALGEISKNRHATVFLTDTKIAASVVTVQYNSLNGVNLA